MKKTRKKRKKQQNPVKKWLGLDKNSMRIMCDKCNHIMFLKRDFRTRHVSELATDYPGLREFGLVCPKCVTWWHISYLDDQLEKLGDELREKKVDLIKLTKIKAPEGKKLKLVQAAYDEWRAQKAQHAVAFDRLNAEIRGKKGVGD